MYLGRDGGIFMNRVKDFAGERYSLNLINLLKGVHVDEWKYE